MKNKSINISIEKNGQYDLIQKYCLTNYYNFGKKKNINIIFPKSLLHKIKGITLKTSDILLRIYVVFYFLYSRRPYLKYISNKQNLKGASFFKISLSIKKILFFQMVNYIDYIFSQFFFYTIIISIYIKYIFGNFFKIKKKNNFLFKIIKI